MTAVAGAVVIALLVCIALYFVVAPIRRDEEPGDEPGAEGELVNERDRAVTALVELEEDRMVGKLSDDDFAALRARYEAEALETLRKLSKLERSRPEDPAAEEDLESEIAALRAELECPNCGRLRTPGAECAECGAR